MRGPYFLQPLLGKSSEVGIAATVKPGEPIWPSLLTYLVQRVQ